MSLGTKDSGSIWTSETLPANTYWLYRNSCPTVSHCYADGSTQTGKLAIISTTNSGTTSIARAVPSRTGQLSGLSCITASSCIAVGSENDATGVVLSTYNSEATWHLDTIPYEHCPAVWNHMQQPGSVFRSRVPRRF